MDTCLLLCYFDEQGGVQFMELGYQGVPKWKKVGDHWLRSILFNGSVACFDNLPSIMWLVGVTMCECTNWDSSLVSGGHWHSFVGLVTKHSVRSGHHSTFNICTVYGESSVLILNIPFPSCTSQYPPFLCSRFAQTSWLVRGEVNECFCALCTQGYSFSRRHFL